MEEMKRIYKYIDSHKVEHIEDLREYLMQPSESATERGLKECSQMVTKYLRNLGFKVDVADPPMAKGGPCIYARLDSAKSCDTTETLLVYAHYDVAPTSSTAWTTPPFEARIVEDKIVARGAIDNKGAHMAFMKAVESTLAVTGDVPVNVAFFLEGEEEVGSPNLAAHIERFKNDLTKVDAMLFPGICPRDKSICLEIMPGFKGMLYLELDVALRKHDIHSKSATILENPAWRLVLALSTMKNAQNHVTIDGFYDDAADPTEKELEMLEELSKKLSEDTIKSSYGAQEFKDGLHGSRLFREYIFGPTFNISGIFSGYTGSGSKSINPAFARAKVDIRLVPNMDSEDVLSKVRSHIAKHGFEDITVTVLSSFNPFKSSADSEIVQAVQLAAIELDFQSLTYPLAPGSGNRKAFSSFGFPFSYYSNGLALSRTHTPNEYIYLEEFANSQKLGATILKKFSKR